MKKILKLLLIFAFAVVQFMPYASVSALNGKNDNSGEITISNVKAGQTYKIYQVLVLESYDTEKEAYTYKVNPAWTQFLTTGEGKDYVNVETGTNIVTWKEGADVKAFSEKALVYAKTITATASQTVPTEPAEPTSPVKFTNLNLGYYLVDSTLGALCNLTTTNPTASIEEKNGIPTVDKEVKEDSTNTFGSTNKDQIGSTVYFKTTINAQNGAENYKLYDKMDAGLTLNESSIEIVLERTIEGETSEENTVQKITLEKDKDYTVSTTETGYTFVIDFAKDFEDTLVAEDKIVVSYNAILNENAVVGGTGNKNETHLVYGDNNKSNYDETRTYTFSFDLIKVNNKNEELSGAEFDLYDAATGGNKINLVKTEDNTYRVATSEEASAEGFVSAKVVAGSVTIKGLDDDASYYLEETMAPNGYNKLTSRVEVKLTANIVTDNTSSVAVSGEESTSVEYSQDKVSIINITGALLPTTGGMGTVLFVTIGLILVLGFGVLLVTKLRISKMAL